MGRITASRKQLKGDPRHNSMLISKFINCLMHDGKKTTAQKVFYDALDLIKEKVPGEEPVEVFNQAIENVKPHIEVRSKRVGGAALPSSDASQQNSPAIVGFSLVAGCCPR